MRKVLVTGGQGYLGTWVAEYFKQQGLEVNLLIRQKNDDLEQWSRDFHLFYGDVLDKGSLSDACEGIDAVIHLASPNEIISKNSPEVAIEVNALGTRNLLEVAIQKKVKKFLYLSTFHVYGKGEGEIDELTPCTPKADYATTHIFGELYCQQYSSKIETSIIRLTNGYGAPAVESIDRWSLIMNDLCKNAVLNKEILLRSHGHQKRDFVWIGDLCKAIHLLLGKENISGETYNVGKGESISMRFLALKIKTVYERMFHMPIDIVFNNPEDEHAIDESKELHVSVSKIEELGWIAHDHLDSEIEKIFDLLKR